MLDCLPCHHHADVPLRKPSPQCAVVKVGQNQRRTHLMETRCRPCFPPAPHADAAKLAIPVHVSPGTASPCASRYSQRRIPVQPHASVPALGMQRPWVFEISPFFVDEQWKRSPLLIGHPP